MISAVSSLSAFASRLGLVKGVGVGLVCFALPYSAGIPERTVYAGVKKNSQLRAATTAAVRAIFREEYERSMPS